jgi:ribosomal protein S27AE
METSNKEMENREKEMQKYLTCPRCGALVAYHRRLRHPCFRAHLMEMERDIARMSWTIRAW